MRSSAPPKRPIILAWLYRQTSAGIDMYQEQLPNGTVHSASSGETSPTKQTSRFNNNNNNDDDDDDDDDDDNDDGFKSLLQFCSND